MYLTVVRYRERWVVALSTPHIGGLAVGKSLSAADQLQRLCDIT